MGEAISYSLKQWDELIEYLNDGKLSIDNNVTERAIRPIAVGRNYAEFYIFNPSFQRQQPVFLYLFHVNYFA